MYEAAKYFSEAARRKVAEESVFLPTRVGTYEDGNGCCVVGALLNAERPLMSGSILKYPGSRLAKQAMRHLGLANPAAGEIPELMRANDRGKLSTPEAVREALGVND